LMRELCRQIIEAHGGMVRIQEAPRDAWKIELLLETKEVPLSDTLSSRSASVAQVPRLLAIQDDGRDPHKLSRRLMEAGFDVDTVISGEQAMARAAQNVYDAIALDLLIHGQSGLSVLQAIRAEGPNASSPVVSVSIAPDTGDVASFAVTDILAKPIRTTEIVEAMRKLQLKLGRTARVLVIDDDPIAIDLMCATLGACHIECLGLSDGRKAIQEIEFRHPDALILDMMMPEFDGFAVLDSLRQSAAGRDIPVFIWTNMTLTWNEYMSLKRSAKAILSKGGGTIEAVRDDLRKRRLG
jgi:CheY-like chemotaxis protein